MSFVVRAANTNDLNQLYELARQFNLLNLPANKRILGEKLERSERSFSGELPKNKAEYLFLLEDVEEQAIVGSSLVLAKHGSDEIPHYYFKVLKKDHFSKDLGVGFIHQVLRFQFDTDGPTEIGGLLIDRNYRRRPEKLGKQISLSRFVYMGMYPERFEDRVVCELTPPLTDEGRSEFWEALGRRFTGLPYQEADILSQSHKEFISSLFPEDDIYLALLDSKARLVLGRVGEHTKPAQHLLESIGFKYLDEVDPFDGGPHYGCKTDEIRTIERGRRLKVTDFKDAVFVDSGLVAGSQGDFRCTATMYERRGEEVALSAKAKSLLQVKEGDEVYIAPF